jgi:FAD-dependent oxidoreductase domain-containing protein 1
VPSRDRYDVVIVGAGALGLASAYHLIQRRPDLSILVVEARSGPGEGSMGASAAMVRDVFGSIDNLVLAQNSIAFYRHLLDTQEELRSPVPLLDQYGYLWLLPERERTEYSAILQHTRQRIETESLDASQLASCPGLDPTPGQWFEGDHADPPDGITGGLFGRNCGAVAPEMLAAFYCREARRLGVEFAFDSVVQRLSFEGREEILLHEPSKMPFAFQQSMRGRLRISRVTFGDGRSVQADTVIVAGGAWSSRILDPLGFATACTPRRQILFAVSGPVVDEMLRWTPPVHPIDAPEGRPRFPFLVLPSGITLKPIFPQRHLWVGFCDMVGHPIGTREDPARDGRLDYNMAELGDRESFATDVLPGLTPYFPRFETPGVRLENTWGGYYTFSPEGAPVLTEELHGVIFVGGDSGSGVMKADSLGRLIAARYDGQNEGQLYSGESYRIDRLSLAHRSVEEEKLIL